MPTITSLEVIDVRFPTSRTLDGSDAMNPDPDYSAAYVVLRTDGRGADPHALGVEVARRLVVECGGAMLLEDVA